MTGYPTSIGTSDATSITLLGHDLAGDLMGKVGFTELSYWLMTTRRPQPGQLRVFDAVLVALADHGFTPTALAARLTLLGAPDSIQGALAAGLLGGGSVYLGVTEDCGRFLDDALTAARQRGHVPQDDAGFDAVAREAVGARRSAGRLVPGLGHPVHKDQDPRTPVLITIAEQAGVRGPYLRLFEAVGRVSPELIGRSLPLNGAGACGAALCDAGVDVAMLRAVALLARTAGLLGHLAEEMRRPVAPQLYHDVDRATQYLPPALDETSTTAP